MDPGLADQILEGGDQDDFLGGKSMEATVLFSDIRSFTTISETLGATGTVSMLNDYFTIMVDCITSQGGMLDKFIGDAIMAVFGIPLASEDDPDRAAKAAVNMLRELQEWNKGRAARGEMEIRMGLGLNTDAVVSGNIGSPRRMDYTVIGDGVNLAARLESACKQYGAELLISEYTAQKLSGIYRMRDLDRVIVKGKTEPVAVYEVIEHYDEEAFPNAMDVLGHFKEGIAAYREADFAGAIPKFNAALAAHPGDKASTMYIERCQHLIEEPPAGEWNGVWTMTSK